MDIEKQKRLEAAGWKIGDAEDFLELTEAERRLVDLRVKLGAAIRRLRAAKGLTQKALATMLGTSQARVVDVEAAVSSLDMLVKAFLMLGGELAQLDTLGAPLTDAERTERVSGKARQAKRPKATAGKARKPIG